MVVKQLLLIFTVRDARTALTGYLAAGITGPDSPDQLEGDDMGAGRHGYQP